MCAQLAVALVEVSLDGRFPDREVHPFDLAGGDSVCRRNAAIMASSASLGTDE